MRVFTSLFELGMIVYEHASEINNQLVALKNKGKKVGFVPTMGALHEGHISLVNQAKNECNVVVVSIFVNPKQFNNASDLEKYPRTIEQDVELLTKYGVDCVFTPNMEEIYPKDYVSPKIELGILEKVMEGAFRPGHFNGVVEVVKRLFEIIEPRRAYFGQKDFQQVAVIKFMTQFFKLPVEIVECPIVRSNKGLALSSRNMRLSETEKNQALVIYQSLVEVKNNVGNMTPNEAMQFCEGKINQAGLKTEYVEIVDSKTFERLTDKWISKATCCIAAYCGEVRLIDNMVLVD
ncbi:MAG: pantoate--beta-alanine ligase [Crocinitomicaceae bacterium]|nr:pantoate--beta-alanine ligase [Crocinitomicaceae bacterium]